MPFIRCPACQTRYQITAAAGGKRSRCTHCGQVFKIPDLAPAEKPSAGAAGRAGLDGGSGADLIELEGISPSATVAPDTGEPADAIPITATVAYASGPTGAAAVAAAGAYGAYFRSVARSLAFPARLGDLITFAIVWVLLVIGQVLAPFALCIGGIVNLIVAGWYMSFRLNVVVGAAAGEEELPTLTLTGGVWDDIVAPFFRMLTTYVVIWAPVTIFLASTGELAGIGVGGWMRALAGGLVPLLSGLQLQTQIIAAVLLLSGYLVWPLLVLVIAVGESVRGLFRVDLIARTIVKSLPAYLMTVLIVYASLGMSVGFEALLDAVRAGRPLSIGGLPNVLVLGPVLLLVELYSTIIAMRAIGLYYRHFKHKFAWTWE